jgi:hypothetical protein
MGMRCRVFRCVTDALTTAVRRQYGSNAAVGGNWKESQMTDLIPFWISLHEVHALNNVSASRIVHFVMQFAV